jgi:hypothetical protein
MADKAITKKSVTLLSPYSLILSCLLRQSWVRAGRTTEIPKHRSLPPQTQ